MTQASNQNASQSHLQKDRAPPRQPGVDWFHSETTSREMLMEVRVINGELTVWWPNEDQPVTDLKDH